jgi:hypothetical protein
MAIVFIEAWPQGHPEGSPITDFVVENQASQVLHISPTQDEANRWAKNNGHTAHIPRVRHMNDKNTPDDWRAV